MLGILVLGVGDGGPAPSVLGGETFFIVVGSRGPGASPAADFLRLSVGAFGPVIPGSACFPIIFPGSGTTLGISAVEDGEACETIVML